MLGPSHSLVIAGKPHFGWLVGPAFVPMITVGGILGGVLMLIGSLLLPERRTWRGLTLIVWSVIAMTSPVFGLMFLSHGDSGDHGAAGDLDSALYFSPSTFTSIRVEAPPPGA